jgi:hypothetical protein
MKFKEYLAEEAQLNEGIKDIFNILKSNMSDLKKYKKDIVDTKSEKDLEKLFKKYGENVDSSVLEKAKKTALKVYNGFKEENASEKALTISVASSGLFTLPAALLSTFGVSVLTAGIVGAIAFLVGIIYIYK